MIKKKIYLRLLVGLIVWMFTLQSYAYQLEALQTEISSIFGVTGIEQLESGKVLVHEVKKSQSEFPWPTFVYYGLIKGKNSQAAEIFSDYEKQKTYLPGFIKSQIVKKISDEETHVTYVMKMPWPLKNSVYTTTNIVFRRGDTYGVEWHQVEATDTDLTDGEIRFYSYQQEKIIVRYEILIVPKSFLAPLLKNHAKNSTQKAVEAILLHLRGRP